MKDLYVEGHAIQELTASVDGKSLLKYVLKKNSFEKTVWSVYCL